MNPPTEPNVDPFATGYSLPFDLPAGPDLSSAFSAGAGQAPFDWTQFAATGEFEEQRALEADDYLVEEPNAAQEQPPIAGPSTGVDLALGDNPNPALDLDETAAKPPHKRPPRPAKPPPSESVLADRSCARCRERKGGSGRERQGGRGSGRSDGELGVGQGRPGSRTADSARSLTVKCDRAFPQCRHCKQRREDCDLATWAPKPPKSVPPRSVPRPSLSRRGTWPLPHSRPYSLTCCVV